VRSRSGGGEEMRRGEATWSEDPKVKEGGERVARVVELWWTGETTIEEGEGDTRSRCTRMRGHA